MPSPNKLTNGSYREFTARLREASEAPGVFGLRWAGHYVTNHLRDAANEIERLRKVVRVNALRHGASHGDVDGILFHGQDFNETPKTDEAA